MVINTLEIYIQDIFLGKTFHNFKEAYHKPGENILLIENIKEGFYGMNKGQMNRQSQ